MSSTDSAAPAEGAARTAEVGGERVTIQRPNGAKASRALAELRQAGGAVTAVTEAWGEFIRG